METNKNACNKLFSTHRINIVIELPSQQTDRLTHRIQNVIKVT
jgi:hypothetical protein